jgi:hypothetical protein
MRSWGPRESRNEVKVGIRGTNYKSTPPLSKESFLRIKESYEKDTSTLFILLDSIVF